MDSTLDAQPDYHDYVSVKCSAVNGMLIACAVAAGLFTGCRTAGAAVVPIEPETENVEYLLDLWVNRFDRYWREVYDGGDNRFRYRLGSNNVREWFIEEELKFTAPMGERFRFRFWHSRLIHDSSDRQSHETAEFEGRVAGDVYLSVLISTTFKKASNSLGFRLQHRQKVNQYAAVYIDFPHLIRNWAERHGDTGGKTLTVFTDQPLLVGFDIREPVADNVWLRLRGEAVPTFETGLEDGTTGQVGDREQGRRTEVNGWLEYVRGPERPLARQAAVGVEFGYRDVDKNGESPRLFPMPPGAGESGQSYAGDDFYTLTAPDSVAGWEYRRSHVAPFAWMPLSDRLTLKCSFMYVDRTIGWRDRDGRTIRICNKAVVPGVGVLFNPWRGRTWIEAGLAAEYRRRVEDRAGGGTQTRRLEDRIDDHRIFLACEFRFGEGRAVRLIETIDLDREDWGAFSIHDHAFVQLLFEF